MSKADVYVDEFQEEFAIWGIDPLWREPDEEGNEKIIYWVGHLPPYIAPSLTLVGAGMAKRSRYRR